MHFKAYLLYFQHSYCRPLQCSTIFLWHWHLKISILHPSQVQIQRCLLVAIKWKRLPSSWNLQCSVSMAQCVLTEAEMLSTKETWRSLKGLTLESIHDCQCLLSSSLFHLLPLISPHACLSVLLNADHFRLSLNLSNLVIPLSVCWQPPGAAWAGTEHEDIQPHAKTPGQPPLPI